MSPLTFSAVSVDGAHLLLVDDEGVEFTLEVTGPLRAALQGTAPRTLGSSRPGHLERHMDSALRPRDIQARIRAGESPEAVAEAAQTSLEKVMVYAGPVLAEREHLAQRAQRATVRRPVGDGHHARTLEESVETTLRSHNVGPEGVEWDAWRREDGRWTLLAAYEAAQRQGTATFVFDVPGNYVLLENDDARWLVGESIPGPATPAPVEDDLSQARTRRLSAVPDDQAPLGEDAIELVTGPDDGEPSLLDHLAQPDAPPGVQDGTPEEPETGTGEEAGSSPTPADPGLAQEAAPETDEEPPAEPPTRRTVHKKKGRASVPSWDEIMFGGGDQ